MKFHCHECQHDYEVEGSRPEIARPAGVEEQLRPHGVVFRWWAHGLPLDARWFGSKSVRHQLECRTRSGERLRLLSNEPKARLEFIEQELETFLGIANESA